MQPEARGTLRLEPQPISAEVEALRKTVATCMQCGTCSGSCPSASQMDYTPRQIMLLLQMGLEDEAIRSNAIWTCANCYMCTVRCPREIAVSEVMGALRTLCLQQGLAGRRDRAFVHSFLGIVRRYGRMAEPELLVRYYLQNNPFNLFKRVGFALALLRKGKIEVLPHRLRGVEEVRRIYQEAGQEGV
ncbi:MAG: 4Fe-4S dicluster domain-containing protein [Anaerolineae bacterium]